MKYLVVISLILISFTNLASKLFAYDSNDRVFGKYIYSNNRIIVYGNNYTYISEIQPPIFNYSYVYELDAASYSELNYQEFKQFTIENMITDTEGNKYLVGGVADSSYNFTFLDSAKSSFKNLQACIAKLSNDYKTVEYATIIHGVASYSAKIALTANNNIVFAFQADGGWYDPILQYTTIVPDSVYYCTPNAIQTKRNYSSTINFQTDFYIGEMNSDGKSLNYGTLLGSRGLDYPKKIQSLSNGNIMILGNLDRNASYDKLPSYGCYPTTANAFEPTLPIDSLNKDKFGVSGSTFLGASVITILNPKSPNLVYSSYYAYGMIYDAVVNEDNELFIAGFNRKNDKNLPLGTFIAKFNQEKDKLEMIKTLSPIDIIDSVFTEYYTYGGSKRNTYYALNDRKISFFINPLNSNIILSGVTADATHNTSINALQKSKSDSLDVVIYKFDKNFNTLYCSYFGSSGIDILDNMATIPNSESFYLEINSKKTDYPSLSWYRTGFGILTRFDLGIADVAEEAHTSLSLYPNPASEFINIDEAMLNGSNSIELYNALGVKVLDITPAASRINISELPSGVYTVKFGDSVQNFVKY